MNHMYDVISFPRKGDLSADQTVMLLDGILFPFALSSWRMGGGNREFTELTIKFVASGVDVNEDTGRLSVTGDEGLLFRDKDLLIATPRARTHVFQGDKHLSGWDISDLQAVKVRLSAARFEI